MDFFPDALAGKESACNAGDTGDLVLIPGSGRSPGEGNGNPLQDSCLENPMNRGTWRAAVHGVAKSETWPSTHTILVTDVVWRKPPRILTSITSIEWLNISLQFPLLFPSHFFPCFLLGNLRNESRKSYQPVQ